MANKVPYSIADQISLLKQRGMIFKDEKSSCHFLENISYYRLKGYWWDMQSDYNLHTLKPNTVFEDILNIYKNLHNYTKNETFQDIKFAKLFKNYNAKHSKHTKHVSIVVLK